MVNNQMHQMFYYLLACAGQTKKKKRGAIQLASQECSIRDL